MKKSTKIVAWTLYCISVLILLIGLISSHSKYLTISLASILLLAPWIICIVNSAKSKNNGNGLWVYVIAFFGLVSIPLWLVFHANDINIKN